jgi:trk system potassium uptake protein TrkA
MKRRRKVLVIGIGRFGGALVDELWQSGCEVVAIDKQPEAIESVRSRTSAAFVADVTDPAVLENVGAREMDVAVVTAGEAFEGVVLCVAQLAQLGLKTIFARAANDRQAHVLERVGATRAVQVENEMGRRLAVQVLNPVAGHILDFATHFRVVPWHVTPRYYDKPLAEAGFRRFELNVIGWFAGDSEKPRLNFALPDYQMKQGHTLLLVGQEDAMERFLEHAEE